MIKLSIEEKAKAYDKALERAQALYNDKNEIGYANAESVLEEVFPLLKESEGEKIRKEILQSIRDNMVVIHKDECIAWLEKQAEQKPTLRERYKNIAESEWFKKTHDGMSVSNDEEPKWTDDDEKIRKWLIEYFKKINEEVACKDKKKIIAWLEKQGREKPQRMISAEAKEAMYDKPDWSEKDENVLEDIEEAIINYWHGDTQDILLDWLKFLRPQNNWKPSDEQMKQLGWIAEQNKDNMIGKELISLYQDLKKLREE